MTKIDPSLSTRHELLTASDDVIEDAVKFADPMVLRALLYQLTGDQELVSIPIKQQMIGFFMGTSPARPEDAKRPALPAGSVAWHPRNTPISEIRSYEPYRVIFLEVK